MNGFDLPDVDFGLPWEEGFDSDGSGSDLQACCPAEAMYDPVEEKLSISSVSRLLDQMIMDIQHLEVEVVRARYRLSFHLKPPYDEYMRMELFSSMGGRYQGNPVFDEYLHYRGFSDDEDAIDTPFHVARMLRLASGHDDYPDLYP